MTSLSPGERYERHMRQVEASVGAMVVAAATLEFQIRMYVWDLIGGDTDAVASAITERKTLGGLVSLARKIAKVQLPPDPRERALALLARVEAVAKTRNQYAHAHLVAGSDGTVGKLRYTYEDGHPHMEETDVDLEKVAECTREMRLLSVKAIELSNEAVTVNEKRRRGELTG